MLAFVTVGSTRFDSLISAIFTKTVLLSFRTKGYTNLVVQCGNSAFEFSTAIQDNQTHRMERAGVDIEFYKFKPSLQEDYEKADLVVSHAGSGTILDVRRMGKPMIVVPNPTLLDNHQEELALALQEMGYLKSTSVENLAKTINDFDPSDVKPFPAFDGSRFARIMDEEMVQVFVSSLHHLNMTLRALEAAKVEGDPQTYEDQNVHAIYNEIASHFSSTRYKPWPIIAAFLQSLTTGSIGLDSGTGNGKYLPLPLDRPGDIWTIGLDRSKNLLGIARTAGNANIFREVVLGNVLDNPWRKGIFDYAISIATIHHLATHERRRMAVQCLIQSTSPVHGRLLIYVWAIEQDELSKRKVVADEEILSSSGKDVIVPWVLSNNPQTQTSPQVFNRYYHMFAKGELSGLVLEAAAELGLQVGQKPPQGEKDTQGIEIVQDGWERSNYYVELQRWQI
ncbi:tRNA (carboxymethyluridine(34)-5-O)-methyltransferase [Psilocybe cubensis]|uniref:tRNA (Carboxymethyluridine(34)-5-O)-methyltransferase n=2 Tax=Psilocybe cubensis TaxID=181762 RepID=A0ACB8HA35_PSICU|nr:tRNA (carboxymethyluridine(34)-5-O)-methyltransferase [Psilocybe cubensis]KAH9484025.1 tRNA (carboxymethyluridine(34)-5-O)-methyltransferase [Psilocybe cubensis]